jgi:SpoVK/Ycf46/Vps4 family AAA+-type ATPase
MNLPARVARELNARLPAKDMAQVRAIVASADIRANTRQKALLLIGRNAAAAAGAVATQLRGSLLRIGLSAVTSKYIGETEKNLAKVFAKAAGAVLLFDEADALFGKRTGVKDAHDRFAEINFLLQRIGKHRGLVILVSKPGPAVPMTLLRRFSVYRFPPDRFS